MKTKSFLVYSLIFIFVLMGFFAFAPKSYAVTECHPGSFIMDYYPGGSDGPYINPANNTDPFTLGWSNHPWIDGANSYDVVIDYINLNGSTVNVLNLTGTNQISTFVPLGPPMDLGIHYRWFRNKVTAHFAGCDEYATIYSAVFNPALSPVITPSSVVYGFDVTPTKISLSGVAGDTAALCHNVSVRNNTTGGDSSKVVNVKNPYNSSIRVWDQMVQQTGGYFFFETDNSTIDSQICMDPNGLSAGTYTDQIMYAMYFPDNTEIISAGRKIVNIDLTLSEPPPPPPIPLPADFSIDVTPTYSLATPAEAGTPQIFIVAISSIEGFNSAVNLAVTSGCPSGATCALANGSRIPPSNGTIATTLTVIPPAGGFVNGDYEITITGTSGGLSHNDSADMTVNLPALPECTIDSDCNDGRSCTTDRCVNNSCVNTNNPVDGHWSEWSECSASGTKTRTCVPPLCGGAEDCSGSSTQLCIPSPTTVPVTVTASWCGVVRSVPSGIDCGTACTADFEKDSTVSLTAFPSSQCLFVGWLGDCAPAGANPVCNLVADEGKNTTPVFGLKPFNYREF